MTTKPLFIRSSPGRTRLAHRHVRCRHSQRKMGAEKDAPISRAVQTVGQPLAVQFWAGCTTNITERELLTGTMGEFVRCCAFSTHKKERRSPRLVF
jgi:hypothetical protein